MSSQKQKGAIYSRRLVRVVCLWAVLFFGAVISEAAALELLLATGEAGTFSHFIGRGVSRTLNQHAEGLTCKVQPTPDEIHMLTNLRSGSLDIVLVDSRMVFDAFNSKGRFQFMGIRYDTLRILLPLYKVPLTLVVRKDAGIDSLNTLKGKRINIGPPGSLQRLAMETLFQVKGWKRSDFPLAGELPPSQSQDTMAFCHGTFQAMATVGVHPNALLDQLLKLCGARMVDLRDPDMDALIRTQPAYSKVKIAAGTYPSQPEAVHTIGSQGMLMVSEDLDEDLAYRILEAIHGNFPRLKSIHPALFQASFEEMGNSKLGIPLHPGAARYYKTHP